MTATMIYSGLKLRVGMKKSQRLTLTFQLTSLVANDHLNVISPIFFLYQPRLGPITAVLLAITSKQNASDSL